ncbi:MAG: oxygenase MpaB family protein [Thermocrispum sp.]
MSEEPDQVPEPELFARGPLRLAARLMGAGDLRADRTQLSRLRAFAQADDPLADAVAALLQRDPRSRELFERGLHRGVDHLQTAPEELWEFFHEVERTPYWVDAERVDRGARTVVRTGLVGMIPLGDMSLMGGYLASRAVKTLIGTGDLEHATARRLAETATWWIDVTTPGALRPGADGYAAALRVRLLHAQVRAAMNRRDDWDYAAWDRPVNQVQTVGTLLLFSQVFLLGTQMLGVRYTQRERDDVLHLWRYVGWLMGVDDELLPAGEEDAWRLLWLLAATEFIPDEDSRRLAGVLLEQHAAIGQGLGPLSGVVGKTAVNLHAAVSRMLLGGPNADYLGLPAARVTSAAVLTFAAANFAAETARRRMPGATTVQRLLGQRTRSWYLTQVQQSLPLDRSYSRLPRATAGSGAA